MENASEGSVLIDLDRERRIRFGYNALCRAEPLLVNDFSVILNERRLNLSDTRTLLWAGLSWEDDRLTIERVGNMIEDAASKDEEFMTTVRLRILEAIAKMRMFKRADEGNGPAETAAKPSVSANGSTPQNETPTDR